MIKVAQSSPSMYRMRMDLTARFRAFRASNPASLADLAEATGLSVATLHRLEHGRVKPGRATTIVLSQWLDQAEASK